MVKTAADALKAIGSSFTKHALQIGTDLKKANLESGVRKIAENLSESDKTMYKEDAAYGRGIARGQKLAEEEAVRTVIGIVQERCEPDVTEKVARALYGDEIIDENIKIASEESEEVSPEEKEASEVIDCVADGVVEALVESYGEDFKKTAESDPEVARALLNDANNIAVEAIMEIVENDFGGNDA